MFVEVNGEVGEVWKIKTVEPDDGGIVPTLFIRAFLAMIMPVPRWRHEDIPGPHGDTLALDCGEATVALDDESHGKGRVTMGRCNLSGLDQLQASVERIRGEWSG
jgi:hypothetical protein